jgi:glycine/sarcosine N-methyltransferase
VACGTRRRGGKRLTMEAREFYDALGGGYDVMVSWDERLRREEPFLRTVFADHGVAAVLDAACGTGRHAVAFARWGVRAAGADLSPAMIDRAREHASSAGVDVAWAVAGFGALAAAFPDRIGCFDAVTCLGNSLPHLADDAALEAALADMAAMLRPGGVLVVQDRNYDRVIAARDRFMPIAARGEPGDETLFLRITDFLDADRLMFTIVTLRHAGGTWSCSASSTPLRGIERSTLERALARAGFSAVDCFGSYARAPFGAPGTTDLVIVARSTARTKRRRP